MRRVTCHSEHFDFAQRKLREESLTNVRSTYTEDPSLITQDDREGGFTLVEVLVAIAITAIVGTIMVVIFTNTLRGSNKAQLLSVIKQNGQAVLENMDKTIRNADDVICPTDGRSSDTVVVVKDGVYTRYRIVLPNQQLLPTPPSCFENGCIIWDNPPTLQRALPTVQGTCDSADPMSPANILTDTDTKTGVLIVSGSFSTNKPAGSKAAVTVEFKLRPGTGAPSVITGQIDPVAFQTTIELRN